MPREDYVCGLHPGEEAALAALADRLRRIADVLAVSNYSSWPDDGALCDVDWRDDLHVKMTDDECAAMRRLSAVMTWHASQPKEEAAPPGDDA